MTTSSYFDHNATTPLDPRAASAMVDWLRGPGGNPSSAHRFGQAARARVEEARERVAALLGAEPVEILFEASGSEANNHVFHSVLEVDKEIDKQRQLQNGEGGRPHLVVSTLEHPSILEPAKHLEATGFEVTWVAPGLDGRVDAKEFLGALRPGTRLAALMLAHNELGTIQPVSEVAAGCRAAGVPLLCDAVQAVGKVAVEVSRLGADFVVAAAHKINGPLGAAALWTRPGVELDAFVLGGGQERRRRAGTENVAALIGFGVAAQSRSGELEERALGMAALRDRFEAGLASLPGCVVHCAQTPRLPNTSHFHVEGLDANALLIRLDLRGFAVSTGSACASGVVNKSSALRAVGLGDEALRGSLRVSFGQGNDEKQVDRLFAALQSETEALRVRVALGGSPLRAAAAVSS